MVHFPGPPEATTPGSFSTLTLADELFFRLDRSVLEANGRTWRIEICGIHGSGSRRWVQLELIGDENYRLTLRADRLTAGRIRALLGEWLAHSHETESAMRVVGAARA